MTGSQKLAIRAGEIRTRLSELGAVEELTDDQRAELDRLRNEYGDVERRHAAALIAEDKPIETRMQTTESAEDRELREIREKVEIGDYIDAAQEQRGLDGAAAEYNEALGVRPGRFPLSLLIPEMERRATTDAESETNQGTWIDRLFSESMARSLGVTFRSVSPGVASYPVTTAGASAAQRGRTEDTAVSAWTVGTTELKPKRHSTHLEFSLEDDYRMPGLSEALRRDMQAALMESVDRSIFLGDTGATGTDSDITGLTTATGVAETTLTQANKVKGDKVLEVFASLIDGKHATGPGSLNVVASVGSNVLWMTTVHNAAAENQTVAQFLQASGINWMTRGDIDAATSNGKFGAFVGLGRGIEGAATAAVWDEGMFIRDPYTKAKSGEILLTLCYFWDFALPRASNFKRIKYVS